MDQVVYQNFLVHIVSLLIEEHYISKIGEKIFEEKGENTGIL